MNLPDITSSPVTLDRIAHEAGVSASTVSRYLNGTAKISEKKRLVVEATIARFNFKPNMMARFLAKGQTQSIGVLTQYIDSPFYGEALRGIEDALSPAGYVPLFVSGHWDLETEMARISLLQQRQVDGIIVLTGRLDDKQLVEFAKSTPIVVTGHNLSAPNLISLKLDNVTGAYDATKHLIELGHTSIAFLAGLQDRLDARERMQGYINALEEAGISFNSELVVQADFLEAGGIIAIQKLLLRQVMFTAIFAANDQTAYGARLALHRNGLRVPEDVSLVGFDDLPNSTYCVPPLTTVRQPVYELGRLAADAVLSLISGKPGPELIPPVKLIVRESTRRLQSVSPRR